MPVNTTLASLSTTAAANGPDGGADPPSALDDALRYHGAFIAQLRDAMMPVGSVILFDGLTADLPGTWKVCDGTNGTRDMRDRFPMGASSTRPPGTTGGSANAIVVAHQHSYSGATGTESALHSHGVSDPGHQHTANFQSASGSGYPGATGSGDAFVFGPTGSAVTGIALGTESSLHTHGYSGTTTSTGGSATDANLPPFLAMTWIKRVA